MDVIVVVNIDIGVVFVLGSEEYAVGSFVDGTKLGNVTVVTFGMYLVLYDKVHLSKLV